MPHFFTICGSLRAGSHNGALLRTAEAEILRLGATFDRFEALRTIAHFDQDHEDPFPDEVLAVRDAVTRADGIIIAAPAYNGALPGALKDWLDWMSRPLGKSVLTGKPLAILTSSIGPNAGSQAAEYLERIGKAFRTQMVYPITSVPAVHTLLEESGAPSQGVRTLVNETAQAMMLVVRGAEVVDNEDRQRFELVIDNEVTGFSTYRRMSIGDTAVVELPHTVTEPAHRGRGMAAFLTRSILDRIAEADGTKVIPSCDFVAEYISTHTKYQPLLHSR